MSEHTPTPWRVDPKRQMRIVAGEDDSVATTGSQSDLRDAWEANAVFIVKAVNNHDVLVKALEEIANASLFGTFAHTIATKALSRFVVKP